ncbi:MAG: MFS transporter, partial [Terriglobia bacterium]
FAAFMLLYLRPGMRPAARPVNSGLPDLEVLVKVRWWICFLLFLTWLMSYVDRSLMPMALPFIGKEFHLSPTMMGVAASAFFVGYGVMQIPGGILADRFGPRKVVTMGVFFWSLFSVLTGAASSLTNLIWVRIFFGLGEGIHPPAAFKALAAWFNSSERSRANGVVMSSNTLAPMIVPIVFALLIGHFGWRAAFYLASIPGFLIAWAVYRYLRDTPAEHPKLTAEELAEMGTEAHAQEKLSYSRVLRYKALWQLVFIYMAWDMTWWGFQTWLPSYLLKARGFTLLRTGVVTGLPFAAGFAGVLTAAYISDRTGRRKTVLVAVLLGSALFLLLTATATNAHSAIIFLTATGFFLPSIQGPFWSLPMDLLPSTVMGCSTGFINTGGQIAGVVAPIVIGSLIQMTGHYRAGFIFMAVSAGVCALLVVTLRQTRTRSSASVASGISR